MQHNYFVYILTNISKTVFYTGVTNDLQRRLYEHKNTPNSKAFTSKYNCFYLIYFERFQYIEHAIELEKRIKRLVEKKERKVDNRFQSKLDFSK